MSSWKAGRGEQQTVNPFYSLPLPIQPQIVSSSPTEHHLMSCIRCTMEAVNRKWEGNTHILCTSTRVRAHLPHFPALGAGPGGFTPADLRLLLRALVASPKTEVLPRSPSLCGYLKYLILFVGDSRCSVSGLCDRLSSKWNTWFFSHSSSQPSHMLLSAWFHLSLAQNHFCVSHSQFRPN